jgi:hypothetical protein
MSSICKAWVIQTTDITAQKISEHINVTGIVDIVIGLIDVPTDESVLDDFVKSQPSVIQILIVEMSLPVCMLCNESYPVMSFDHREFDYEYNLATCCECGIHVCMDCSVCQ